MTKVKEIDLTKLIKPYIKDNLWLALNRSLDKVLAYRQNNERSN